MEKQLLIDTVEKFINLCDLLLYRGKISEDEYKNFTKSKKNFLEAMK